MYDFDRRTPLKYPPREVEKRWLDHCPNKRCMISFSLSRFDVYNKKNKKECTPIKK